MLDELKILLDLVKGLPSMAMWVLVGLFAYKVCIIGSVFGVLRLIIIKTHDWLTAPKKMMLGGKPISEEVGHALQAQISRIVCRSGYNYVHASEVDALRKAIDLMEAQEAKK